MSQLIILGNGFDLACGLKSSFRDFLDWRIEQLGPNALSSPASTAFDLILSGYDNTATMWSDIESAMQELFVGKDGKKTGLDEIYHTPKATGYDSEAHKTIPLEGPGHCVYQFAKHRLQTDRHISPEQLATFLRDELSRYEESFRECLQQEVDEQGKEYLAKARSTLQKLLDDNVLNEEHGPWGGTVLSFNYTTPFSDFGATVEDISFYNIHGNLQDHNIIFGIDGQDVDEANVGLPFTKTYRLLSMKPLGYRSLVYPPTDEDHAPTNCIKVYGHSLAQADYSYFQSLFDAVSLYDGMATLVFYYSLYGEGEDEERDRSIRERLHRSVMHLLTSYGKTFDNKDHGKNLVHKLLLEGRLIIKRIDVE